ncbi:MAG: transcriptional regulator [Chitinophagaceae bacterium]|nr:MAG: transcriptional regulator [Chitinophagaceae bacterium]
MKKKLDVPVVCPVDFAFKRIGGKYKARILWHVHRRGVLRYGELRRTLPDATTKMLTQSLRELEEDALIHREAYVEVPPRVEYRLTDIARELMPAICLITEWGDGQMKKKQVPEKSNSR